MKTKVPADILLFGGQGSSQHMTDRKTVAELKLMLGEAEPTFQAFLQQCLEAFHSECAILGANERSYLTCDSARLTYQDSESLLFPPEAVRSHPVAETISLYLRQILELVVLAVASDVPPHVVETTGVCTGIIPAVLAASSLSYESERFFGSALEGFRLALWIGIRAALACPDGSTDQTPRVLSIFGWPKGELERALLEYQTSKGEDSIRISTTLDKDVHSLSGPGQLLDDFNATAVPSHARSRRAHIHALYHAGAQMNSLVARITEDVESRGIDFPTWGTLLCPVRSSATGTRMSEGSGSESLLETVLRAIFVDVCDWKTTSENLHGELLTRLKHDSKATFRALCVGPGTRSLVQNISEHNRLSIVHDVHKMQKETTDDMIAIVGMSLNYPGANGREELWEMLENARSASAKIPASRFGTSSTLEDRIGHFLDDPFQFDPAFFNISPREAKSMDPQQRLVLQAAFEALEDSGYAPNSTATFQENTFGVYVGVATNDYVDNLRDHIDVYYSPGTLRAFLSGRISYAFNFLGPSIVVDTACSSSLVALHQACRAIQLGECTAALAGGVNTISSPDMYKGLARAHFLSPSGQCKPFDARADGYSRAEGCGLVVVKKLSAAIEENDHIYGIIRGIGVNQCGTAKSITHPDHTTQAALFHQVLTSSHTAPDSIDVVEAHGTGTQAGDNAEVSSLRNTFGPRSESRPLYISSIKGNIGHAEAASGLAGLGKLLVMMQQGKVPPQASFETTNPSLVDRLGHMVIPTKVVEWKRRSNQDPRRAMLNNFGAAGSNVALILEEYLPNRSRGTISSTGTVSDRSMHCLNLSAKSERVLAALQQRYISYLESHPDSNILDLCYTTSARRQLHGSFRMTASGSTPDTLARSLRDSQCTANKIKHAGSRKLVFVFSGQGHAHAGMGAELLYTVPSFRRIVEICDETLSEHGFPVVGPYLSNSLASNASDDAGMEVTVTQCALFVLEFALARMWMQWGVAPDVVVGHSIGEYAALAIADTLDVKDALLLVARRAQLIGAQCVPGDSGMMTCRGTAEKISTILERDASRFSGLSIACLNGPEDTVVAGPTQSLANFDEYAKANNVRAKPLKVPYGFHSSCMDPILDGLKSCALTTRRRQASIAIGSSLEGRLLKADETPPPEYFTRHSRDPVNFVGVLQDLQRSFPDSQLDFIEIGPFPSTELMVRRSISEDRFTFLPSLKPTQKPWEVLSHSLGSLFVRKHPVRWRQVYDGTSAKLLLDVPRYPMNSASFFVPYKGGRGDNTEPTGDSARLSYEFLGSGRSDRSKNEISYHTNLVALAPYIKAHSVGGAPLCPASVLMELSLEALSLSIGSPEANDAHLLEEVAFENPLVYRDHGAEVYDLQTKIDSDVKGKTRFALSSGSQLHCSGIIARKLPKDVADTLKRKSALVSRQRSTVYASSSGTFDSFSPQTIYNVIFPRVVTYSEPFLTLKQFSVSESRLEGFGKLKPLGSLMEKKFVCHPAFLDTMLHAPGFIANMYVPADVAAICVEVEHAYLPSNGDMNDGDLSIFCSLTDLNHSVIADAYIVNSTDKMIAYVEGARFKKIPLKSFQSHLSRANRSATSKAPPGQPSNSVRQPPAAPRSSARPPPSAIAPSPTHIAETIKSIIQECCGAVLDPKSSVTLAEAGVDSLMLIEITRSIRDRLPQLQLDDHALEGCSTLQELVEVVSGTSPFIEAASEVADTDEAPKIQEPAVQTVHDMDVASPITALLSDICGIDVDENMMDQALGDLGVDSLLSIELIDELRSRYGLVIDSSQHHIPDLTVNGLKDIISEGTGTSDSQTSSPESSDCTRPSTPDDATTPSPDSGASSPLRDVEFQRTIQQQTHGPRRSTVYLFHDGSGHCSMYARMSEINRNVIGIYSPGSDNGPRSLEDLASFYISRTALKHDQTVFLGGYSFGGVLAFEVARQLLALGRTVEGLLLIDAPLPIDHQPLPQEVISYIAKKMSAGPEATAMTSAAKQARERVNKNFQYHAGLIQTYQAKPQAVNIPCVALKCARSMDTQKLANVSYPWLGEDDFRTQATEQWQSLIGQDVPILDIPCHHFEVFDAEHVGEVSKQVVRAFEFLG
ncbi:hypothetical protein F5Y18DRAFT_202343 [Xylariaceae sp. FL1019]|nr:hypothetical protein F5Y18DRAFT_202343 [Xylariaceae sp. FL1019]